MAEAKTTTKKVATKKTTTKKVAPKAVSASGGIAVIETGAKQYVVQAGTTIKIEKLRGDLKEGDTIVFDKVLMTDNGSAAEVGTPYLDKKTVEGKLTEIGRNKKIDVIKFHAKSRYHKKRGHRQPYFKVEITKV